MSQGVFRPFGLVGPNLSFLFGRREKTPTPKTRFSIWTLLRTPGRFTTRPFPVHFTTKMSVVRPFSALSKTGRILSKAKILGVRVFSPLSICPFQDLPDSLRRIRTSTIFWWIFLIVPSSLLVGLSNGPTRNIPKRVRYTIRTSPQNIRTPQFEKLHGLPSLKRSLLLHSPLPVHRATLLRMGFTSVSEERQRRKAEKKEQINQHNFAK